MKGKIMGGSARPLFLERLPEARNETIADLMVEANRGRVRIPDFQRPFRWRNEDVIALIDSIYKGLPVGSLLLWKQAAPAEILKFGPVQVSAQAYEQAWLVVDGQQRLTSLIAGLLRSLPLPTSVSKDDPFVVYFDAQIRGFVSPSRQYPYRAEWIPLPVLLDATQLSEWVHSWALGQDPAHRRAAFEAGKRLREYRMPLYLVESDDPEVLKEIFTRINNRGRSLEWNEIFDAIHRKKGKPPQSSGELASRISKLGMGHLDKEALITIMIATRGLDPTRSLSEYIHDKSLLEGAAEESYQSLQRALIFLKTKAKIPHLKLLPRSQALLVLSRFFHLNQEPSARASTLLTRWLWRLFLGETSLDERTLLRRSISVITDDSEVSALALLKLVGAKPRKFQIPEIFDARTAECRIFLLGLAHLGPIELATGRRIDVSLLLKEEGARAFKRIFANANSLHPSALRKRPENILFQAGAPTALGREVKATPGDGQNKRAVLASHALAPDDFIDGNKPEDILAARAARIEASVTSLSSLLAAWNRDHDRPSIKHLLRKT